jgi:hypothetical protein
VLEWISGNAQFGEEDGSILGSPNSHIVPIIMNKQAGWYSTDLAYVNAPLSRKSVFSVHRLLNDIGSYNPVDGTYYLTMVCSQRMGLIQIRAPELNNAVWINYKYEIR